MAATLDASVTDLRLDDDAWDEWVGRTPGGAYTQLTPWAWVKQQNGWTPERIVADGGSGPVGALVLVHRLGRTPWSVGYAARGPVATRWDGRSIAAFSEAVRATARQRRLSHVTIDPGTEPTHEVLEALRAAGWRPALKSVQPLQSRVIDLAVSEEQVWAGLRSKWRQYVQKARRGGVVVVEADASGLDAFYAILVETAERSGFLYRTADSYRRVFEAYAAKGAARLLFARLPDGSAGATLMLIEACGHVVEPYGGMTAAGATARANYLIKWEAIRQARERGYTAYDMWGLPNEGIAQFKAGFGGRAVRYVGAWDLVMDAPIRSALSLARRLRHRIATRGVPAVGGPE
jgi:lipid II:glycine glycyltransferase (peptidoglycan interpeptide bridge formation enzyme)